MKHIEITWEWVRFDELSIYQLYEVLGLRSAVFVVEQNCAYQDIDNQDQKAWHMLGWHDHKLSTYLRLIPPTSKQSACNISRMLTAPDVRGKGLGITITQEAIAFAESNYPNHPIFLSTQQYLESFYQQLKFITISEPYIEAGISRIDMMREAKVHHHKIV